MNLLQAYARCTVCGKEWHTNNAMGVAANHFKHTGHEVHVEMTYGHIFRGTPIGLFKKQEGAE